MKSFKNWRNKLVQMLKDLQQIKKLREKNSTISCSGYQGATYSNLLIKSMS